MPDDTTAIASDLFRCSATTRATEGQVASVLARARHARRGHERLERPFASEAHARARRFRTAKVFLERTQRPAGGPVPSNTGFASGARRPRSGQRSAASHPARRTCGTSCPLPAGGLVPPNTAEFSDRACARASPCSWRAPGSMWHTPDRILFRKGFTCCFSFSISRSQQWWLIS